MPQHQSRCDTKTTGYFPTFSTLEKFFKSLFNINTEVDPEATKSSSCVVIDSETMNVLDEMDRSSQTYLSELALSLQKRTCSPEDRILTEHISKQLRRWMPSRYKFATSWSLVYSSAQHGFSLHTMYSMCKHTSPLVLAIKDEQGNIFGAFISDALSPQIGHFGTGECFLWKQGKIGSSDTDQDGMTTVKVYTSTGVNPYFIIAEPEFLAVGCGDGKFGLLLDQDLLNGQSNKVPTFDNEILSSGRDFVCLGIEIWRFDTVPINQL